MNEQDKFLKSIEDNKKVDILDMPLNDEEVSQENNKEENKENIEDTNDNDSHEDDLDIKPKNRRERRLVKKLQEERESAIFLSGKLEARTEAQKAVTEESDYLKAVERIYGTDSPEAVLATDLLKKAIVGARDDAENRAFNRMKEERQKEREEEKAAQDELNGFIEDIEDSYGVNLSETHKKSFFQLLHKMSPKDKMGTVTDYADPHAVWEIFQEKMQKIGTDNRAKSLSSRSMTQSGASKESTLQDDQNQKFLRDEGII